jgi:hypothetical protein
MLTDISLLKNLPQVYFPLVRIMEKTCDPKLIETFKNLSYLVPAVSSPKFYQLPLKDLFGRLALYYNYNIETIFLKFPFMGLGQLQQKVEPAGKMRTFAMVDS